MKALSVLQAWQNETTVIAVSATPPLLFPYGVQIHHLSILNVGCGTVIVRELDYINADIEPGEGVDVVFDCQHAWPFEENQFKAIYASHVIEHLDRLTFFFDEARRCLHPDGCLLVRIPHPRHNLSLAEPDHKRMIPENFFWWLHGEGSQHHNLQSMARQKHPTWFARMMLHVIARDGWMRFFPACLQFWCVEHLWNVATELWVWLQPIKPDTLLEQQVRDANARHPHAASYA